MTSPTHGILTSSGPLEEQTKRSVFADPNSKSTPSAVEGAYFLDQMRRMRIAAERAARLDFEKTHPVDEYQSTPGFPNPGSADAAPAPWTSAVQLQPTYYIPERINSILYTLPVGTTAAIAKLADRWINLMPPPGAQSPATGPTAQNAAGPVTNPGAFGAIVTVTVPVTGFYTVNWSVSLSGTPAGTDANNFQLQVVSAATIYPKSINPGAVGTYPQLPAGVFLTAGQTVGVVAINAVSDGAGYSAGIELVLATGLASPYTAVLDDLGLILNQDDDRLMLLQGTLTAGPTHFELMGYADEIFGAA